MGIGTADPRYHGSNEYLTRPWPRGVSRDDGNACGGDDDAAHRADRVGADIGR
jgi:hypothetical protein